MVLVKENKIFIRQTSKILAMDLIYHISDISNGTLYNQRTKILYNTVQKSMARYITLLSRICNDMFDDFDISTLRTFADDLFRDKSCNCEYTTPCMYQLTAFHKIYFFKIIFE